MLSGKRRDGEGGGGIPQGEFHLCDDCTFVAFHAMTRRPVGEYVDRHQLATEICDAQVERRRS